MREANHASNRIDEENRAAISDVNAEANAALVCNHSIAILEAFVFPDGRLDNSDLVPVDLLRGDEWHISKTTLAANFSVDTVQARERFRLVVRHLEARHAQGESVHDTRQRAEDGKLFSRKLTLAHLPEGIVRVVRVVVVVLLGTGGRFPA